VPDSPPPPSRPGSSPESAHGPSSSRASVPPSEQRPSRSSFSALDAQADHPARLQMIVALVLGLVLVAIPLYLWRRPRAESVVVASGDGGAAPTVSVPAPAPPDEKIVVGDPRTTACHDPGPKKTSADQCDHLVDVEKALVKGIEEGASCAPKDTGGGTITYVADVSFKKKSVQLTTPRDGRSMKNAKVVAACQSAVRGKVQAVSLDAVPHQHARYKIEITATYPGPVKP